MSDSLQLLKVLTSVFLQNVYKQSTEDFLSQFHNVTSNKLLRLESIDITTSSPNELLFQLLKMETLSEDIQSSQINLIFQKILHSPLI
jgi:hypothetical protein